MSENADNNDELSTDDEEVGLENLVDIYNTNLVLILIQIVYCHVCDASRGTLNLSQIQSTYAKLKNIAIGHACQICLHNDMCLTTISEKKEKKQVQPSHETYSEPGRHETQCTESLL